MMPECTAAHLVFWSLPQINMNWPYCWCDTAPRWLISHGRVEEGQKVIACLEDSPFDSEVTLLKTKVILDSMDTRPQKKSDLLTSGPTQNLRRTLIGSSSQIFQQVRSPFHFSVGTNCWYEMMTRIDWRMQCCHLLLDCHLRAKSVTRIPIGPSLRSCSYHRLRSRFFRIIPNRWNLGSTSHVPCWIIRTGQLILFQSNGQITDRNYYLGVIHVLYYGRINSWNGSRC